MNMDKAVSVWIWIRLYTSVWIWMRLCQYGYG